MLQVISDISCVSKHFMFKYTSARSADALGPTEYKISALHLYFAVEHFFPIKAK